MGCKQSQQIVAPTKPIEAHNPQIEIKPFSQTTEHHQAHRHSPPDNKNSSSDKPQASPADRIKTEQLRHVFVEQWQKPKKIKSNKVLPLSSYKAIQGVRTQTQGDYYTDVVEVNLENVKSK